VQEYNVAKLAFSKLTDILSVVPYCNSFILINRRPAPAVHQSRGGAGVNVTKLFIVVTGIGKKKQASVLSRASYLHARLNIYEYGL